MIYCGRGTIPCGREKSVKVEGRKQKSWRVERREERKEDTREGAENLNTGRCCRPSLPFVSAIARMQIWRVGL